MLFSNRYILDIEKGIYVVRRCITAVATDSAAALQVQGLNLASVRAKDKQSLNFVIE